MTKVSLRSKPISKSRRTLYLDFYPPIPHPDTGKETRREFLKLYIFEKPKAYTEKEHNRETKTLAENIRAQRQLQIQAEKYEFLSAKKESQDFLQYFQSIVDSKEKHTTKSNYTNWVSSLKYFKRFTEGKCQFKEVNSSFCENYKTYLQTAPTFRKSLSRLSKNAAYSYFGKFQTVIKQAVNEGYLETNPMTKVKGLKPGETKREFLTLEELQSLAYAECPIDSLKRAALLSALTGLRYVDIQKLRWKEVEHSKEQGYYLRFTQRKTDGVETIPISDQARDYLGDEQDPETRIFSDLPENMDAWMNLRLKQWILNAEIKKNITFHCFRHTYATLQLTLGTDIYTVSKMLGHKNLKTTQIYAKIIDEKKREAANRIKI